MPQSQRKRLRSARLQRLLQFSDGAEYVLDWLQRKPGMAEAVLTAPRAHESRTPLSLAQVYDALPDALHAAAARGYLRRRRNRMEARSQPERPRCVPACARCSC